MLEFGLIFVSGLLGSAHCLGMCGPFALAVGSGSPTLTRNLRRQLLYSMGRVFTYSFAGALAGSMGMQLGRTFPRLPALPAALAIVAGLILIYQGLHTAQVLPRLRRGCGSGGKAHSCLGGSWLQTFLSSHANRDIFLAGVFTGFLPCGLVYAFLALATSSGDLFRGAATMAAFGLGTIPLMVMTGCCTSILQPSQRRNLLKFAAWCVVLAGLISVGRGVSVWQAGVATAAESCPLCPA